MSEVRLVPRTKLWDDHIVLECRCGVAVTYPGHPDNVFEVTCACGAVYRIAEPGQIPVVDRGLA